MEFVLVAGALVLGYLLISNQGKSTITVGGGFATPTNSVSAAPPPVVPVVGVSPVSQPPSVGAPTSPVIMPPIYSPTPSIPRTIAPTYEPPVGRPQLAIAPTYNVPRQLPQQGFRLARGVQY